MMELSALGVFAIALLMSAGSPGPSIAALVARVLVKGWRDVTPFLAAMWIGEITWLTLAIAGLATIAESFHEAFVVIKYCGVAYLLYLAWKMWRVPLGTEDGRSIPQTSGSWRMFGAGLAITLGNPKIMVFYVALLPVILDLKGITLVDWATLSVIVLVVLAFVDLCYVMLAARARLWLRSPKAVRLANRIGAGVMAGAAAAIASR